MCCSSDALGLESTFGDHVTLGLSIERAGTRPALEVKTSIVGERSKVEGAPIETRRLLGVTLVVGVGRARELGCIGKTSRCKLNSGCQSGNGGKC